MSAGARRFWWLSGCVLGLLVALELLARIEPESLAAVAHRVRFKLALLHRKGPVDFVALGSSRSNDGLAPSRLGKGVGFSAATPSSSLPTLEFIASRVGSQKLVLIELSRPQWDAAPLELEADADADYSQDPLGRWLHEHSALLRVRRALALENWPRIAGLINAKQLDGSEWFRSRQLIETFRPPEPPPGVHDDDAWKPTVPVADSEPPDSRVVEGYAKVVEQLRQHGARVVLIAPPLAAGKRAEECSSAGNSLRAAVAKRVDAPLIDFTCAPVDDRWFVDGQHLSSPGRARFTRALAEAL